MPASVSRDCGIELLIYAAVAIRLLYSRLRTEVLGLQEAFRRIGAAIILVH